MLFCHLFVTNAVENARIQTKKNLLLDMKGISVSTGSACSSASLMPSHVLAALGIPVEVIHGTIRMSVGDFTTKEDIDYVVD